MCCYRIDVLLGLKNFQATPTKHDLGTSEGFFSKLPSSIPVLFIWEYPRTLLSSGRHRDRT